MDRIPSPSEGVMTFCVLFADDDDLHYPDSPQFRGAAFVDMAATLSDWRSRRRDWFMSALIGATIDLGCNAGPDTGVHVFPVEFAVDEAMKNRLLGRDEADVVLRQLGAAQRAMKGT
jgi:hypothetical protein